MVISRFAWPGNSFGQQRLEPVDGLNPTPGQRLAAVGEHPQGLKFTVDLQNTQSLGSDRDDRDRVRIARVGLAVMTGIEQAHSRGELGRHVNDLLAGFQEPLGQWSTGSVGALDSPDPVRPCLHVCAHRGVASLVGAEATRAQPLLVVIDDLDGGRQLVGIDPNNHSFHLFLPSALEPDMDGEVGSATPSTAVPS